MFTGLAEIDRAEMHEAQLRETHARASELLRRSVGLARRVRLAEIAEGNLGPGVAACAAELAAWLANGPVPVERIEAEAARRGYTRQVLLAAAERLDVRTCRGRWKLAPG